jgi:hypothetical protein
MKRITNTTDKAMYAVIRVGPPPARKLGAFATLPEAERCRNNYLRRPHGSGAGPVVEIAPLAPGEWVEG